jgi:hypothetical protein
MPSNRTPPAGAATAQSLQQAVAEVARLREWADILKRCEADKLQDAARQLATVRAEQQQHVSTLQQHLADLQGARGDQRRRPPWSHNTHCFPASPARPANDHFCCAIESTQASSSRSTKSAVPRTMSWHVPGTTLHRSRASWLQTGWQERLRRSDWRQLCGRPETKPINRRLVASAYRAMCLCCATHFRITPYWHAPSCRLWRSDSHSSSCCSSARRPKSSRLVPRRGSWRALKPLRGVRGTRKLARKQLCRQRWPKRGSATQRCAGTGNLLCAMTDWGWGKASACAIHLAAFTSLQDQPPAPHQTHSSRRWPETAPVRLRLGQPPQSAQPRPRGGSWSATARPQQRTSGGRRWRFSRQHSQPSWCVLDSKQTPRRRCEQQRCPCRLQALIATTCATSLHRAPRRGPWSRQRGTPRQDGSSAKRLLSCPLTSRSSHCPANTPAMHTKPARAANNACKTRMPRLKEFTCMH